MRSLALALLVLAIPLAGCVGNEGPVSDPPAPPVAPAPLVFHAPVALPQETGAAEPNIAALPDGTLFVTAPAFENTKPNLAEGAAYLWRSTDGGETWEALRAPETGGERSFCSCDADVVTTTDGWVYYTDFWVTPAGGNFVVEASADGGRTWESTTLTTLDRRIDRQWLAADEGGFVALFYALRDSTSPSARLAGADVHDVMVVTSQDHGQTWSTPRVAFSPTTGFPWIAHPRVLEDGSLMLPYGVSTNRGLVVGATFSTDQGQTWTPSDAASQLTRFNNIWPVQGATDGRDRIYLAWSATALGNQTLYFIESPDRGRTWTNFTILRHNGSSVTPWVSATADGRVAVAFYGAEAGGPPGEAGPDTAWHAWVAQRQAPGEPWRFGRVSEDPVKVGPACFLGASCDGDRELLEFPSLTYTPDGGLHVAFTHAGPAADPAVRVAALAP